MTTKALAKQKKVDQHVLDAHWQFVEEFSKESDRAAVIVGAARLDILLYQLLKKFLRPCTSNNDELLEGDSPLATYSSRIHACHRLGLIDDHMARALHLIRKIRNSFAHEVSTTDLSMGSHKDRIRELVGPFRHYDGFDEARAMDTFKHVSGSAADFRVVMAIVTSRLEGAIERVAPIDLSNQRTLIPESWKEGEEVAS